MSEPPQDPRQPEPGWYPDPGGQPVLRWWDGMAWAVHTQSQRADHGSVNVGGDATGDIAAGNAKIDKRRYRFFLPPMFFGHAAKQAAAHWVVTTITVVVAIGGYPSVLP
jgi:Protein of unknown function (DUF2510)